MPFNLKPDMDNFYRKDYPIKGKRHVHAGNCNIKRCMNLSVSFCEGAIDFFFLWEKKDCSPPSRSHITIFIYFNLLYA